VHVAHRLGTRGGDLVCIVGAGPIGLGNTLVQAFLGAEVIVVDVNDYRLELARKCGARHILNSRETNVVDAVRDVTDGRFADKCIEAVGRAETLRLALQVVGKAGTVAAVGEQGEVPIHVSEGLIRRDITLVGSWFYHYSEYPDILDLYRRGLDAGRLITHRFPLVEAVDAFGMFAAGRAGKVILKP
jgi:propanol-preferring alcohol dehydrogenase